MMRAQAAKPRNDWRWEAVAAKDRAFDGVFYFGVRTTGVFCRPSCSSRPPKRQNVKFFVTPTEAEKAGFRACLRCKPQDAQFAEPAAELIANAFRKLRDEELEIASIEDLAKSLKVS